MEVRAPSAPRCPWLRRLGWRRLLAADHELPDLLGVETKPCPRSAAKLERSELDLVLVDEGAVTAEELGDSVGVEELAARLRPSVG